MNLDQILNYVALVATVATVLSALLPYLMTKTKSQKLLNAEKYALQVVQAVAQTGAQLTNEQKKQEATAQLTQLINHSKETITATAEDIDRLIEQAVNSLNGGAK